MPSSHADPQVTITIDTAYQAAGVDAANKGIESLDAAAKQLQAQLDEISQTSATPKGLADQPGLLRRIKQGWDSAERSIRTVQTAIGRVMWWATAVNGTIELGRKIWAAWHRDAIAAKTEIDQLRTAIGELDAKIEAARKQQHADAQLQLVGDELERQNRAYDERITLVTRIAEAESTQARLRAEREGRQLDVDKERLRTQLVMGTISQDQYDEQVALLELKDRERQRGDKEIEANNQIIAAEDAAAVTRAEMVAARKEADRLTKLQQEWGLDPLYFARTQGAIAKKGVEIEQGERDYASMADERAVLQAELDEMRRRWDGQAIPLSEQSVIDRYVDKLSKLTDQIDAKVGEITSLKSDKAELEANFKTRQDLLKKEGFSPLLGNWDGATMALMGKAKGYDMIARQRESDLYERRKTVDAAHTNYDDIVASNEGAREQDLQRHQEQEAQRAYQSAQARDAKEAEIHREGNIARAAEEIQSLTEALGPLETAASELGAKSQESRKALATYGEWADALPKGRTKVAAHALQDRMERYLANADKGLTDPDAERKLRHALNRATRIPRDMRVDLLGMLGDATRAGGAQAKVTTQRGRIAEAEERKSGYERQPALDKAADGMREAADYAREAFAAMEAKATTPGEREAIGQARSSLADGYQTSDLSALQAGAQQLTAQGSPLAGQYIAQVQSMLVIISSLMAQQQQLGAELKAAQRAIEATKSRLAARDRSR